VLVCSLAHSATGQHKYTNLNTPTSFSCPYTYVFHFLVGVPSTLPSQLRGVGGGGGGERGLGRKRTHANTESTSTLRKRRLAICTEHSTSVNLLPTSICGHAVAQLVEALRYKPEGRGFDSPWCHWDFSFA
jgi:hypothetical protein